jgi:hypothetical protein
MEEIKFALDTFYAIMAGALVMWMAAGFTMLEAGLVQKKDVSEIVTKNLGLYSIACIMYLACGFMLMYPGGGAFNGALEGYIPAIGSSWGLSTAMPLEEIGMEYGMDYSQQALLFPSSLCCYCYVNCFRSSCRKNEIITILFIRSNPHWFHLPYSRLLELGRWLLEFRWLF